MTRLSNIDNCRALTGRCGIADGQRRFATTFRTALDLSRCVFDGVAEAPAVSYGDGRSPALPQSANRVRHSTMQEPERAGQKRRARARRSRWPPILLRRSTL